MNYHQIPEDLVRKELSLLLDFEEIRNSQVLSRFIEFVVEKKLSGHEDEIKEYTIAVKGLGKPRDYNPQLDASVRIHAGRLRRLLTQYYQNTGKNAVVHIDIPKGTYIPIFTKRSNGESSSLPVVNRQEIPAVKQAIEVLELHKKPVLAILPFHNLSADNSKDYFVAGLGEQLSTDIAKFQNISVIFYFSTSTFKTELSDLLVMKEKSNIDYVLTGSVRFINETVKINIQLIRTENGGIIFTDTHTKHLTAQNIFEIQDEIINQVTNIIADDNGIIMQQAHYPPLVKPEFSGTQDAINKYFDYTQDYSGEKFTIAVDALEKAVEARPNHALALALLAGLYEDSYILSLTEDKELLAKATTLANLAVELDPLCQHGQKSLAWAFLLSGKKDQSFETIEKCIRLNPEAASIIATMSLAYICQGDYIRGFKWLLETIHLTPAAPASTKLCFSLYYFKNRQYDESLKWLERMAPRLTPFMKLLGVALQAKLDKMNVVIDADIRALEEHARSIIQRKLFDESLINEIIDGLQRAGLTIK